MSSITHTSKGVFLLILAAVLFAGVPRVHAQEKHRAKARIGVFDSRKVALVRYRSGEIARLMGDLQARLKAAEAKNDTNEIAHIKRLGPLHQAQMHDQVFGKGSVNMCFTEWKDVFERVAKEKHLALVVSKWEAAWVGADAELVDVTDAILAVYKPDEALLNMLKGLDENPPVDDALFIED